ncbi:MAG: NAD(P)-dependent oxidoreductase, partial [Patescibacteria group bacterium]|nr:NAD(P)-dependent oxidoreductase [Patescibacteria group bacterium]
IGCGNIGKLTAKYAQMFNMDVIGYDPFISKEDMKKDSIKKKDPYYKEKFITTDSLYQLTRQNITKKELSFQKKYSFYIKNLVF